MANSQRKVVAELTKAWESVVAKGKLTKESTLEDVRKWFDKVPARTTLQTAINEQMEKLNKIPKDMPKLPSAEYVTERTKVKAGKIMADYEEFIGLSEVKKAHARVLAAEAKFMDCQSQRRVASKDLMEVQSKLTELRVELDRAPRGDESYLDLVKKEISVVKEERLHRSRFEDLERMEREVFSELSSALRFSHEKEKAQNEKTKYWSIVGSLIGATLGILGATINNRMKQNYTRQILAETAAQVATIHATVENLTNKVNEGVLTAGEVSKMVKNLKEQEKELAVQRGKLSKSMQESVKVLQQLFTAMKAYNNEKINLEHLKEPEPEVGLMQRLMENNWPYTTVACCVVSVLVYKYL